MFGWSVLKLGVPKLVWFRIGKIFGTHFWYQAIPRKNGPRYLSAYTAIISFVNITVR